ncbi:MAG: tetratricopeptide repeat protein [Rhodospirillales bacterium]|nr:tetratricopeptide repeat protein [Rhodospirillales bacterium]
MKKRKKTPRRKPASKKIRKKGKPANLASGPAAQPVSSPSAVAAGAEALGLAASALQSGRPEEAFRLCGRVLQQNPGDSEALNLAGVAAFQAGDASEALSLLETAVAFRPDFADAHNNLGNVLKAMGDTTAAEAAYRRAVEASPENRDAEFNLGIVLEAGGRFIEAEASYRRCIALDPGAAPAQFNLGNVLKALGRLDEAVIAYRRALGIDPGHAEALNNLGTGDMELGRPADAIHAYRKAIGVNPEFAEAHYNLGVALQETGEQDAAIAAYRRTIKCDPGHAGAEINIGYALKEMGRLDEAEEAYARAIQIAPDYDKVRANLGDLYLQQGNPDAAVRVCDDFLKDHPGNISVLAFKAIALEEKGDRGAVRELYDFDRLLRPVHQSAPDGFDDMAHFNRALGDHVLGHPSLIAQPASHATRFGRHSGELLAEPKGPVAALEGMIMAAVKDYRQAIPPDPAHPWPAKKPKRLGLSVWGVAMDRQGHQLAHIHPSAWLSGVYYLKIPGVVRADDPAHAGWIEFGRAPEDFHATTEPEVRLIRPEEGLMVLFPSYFYHRTVPFESDETRISIAFDVLDLD